ncbi:hypothetical protein BpHYR1_002930 [Brachionus plicatilis]|uniref:Uncharacterized protein n=1 Tax=Brachionus plicatilis TaxID=10195 RepID=A0A3M7RC19_BRAPC|nr:hypothetical protein BpHYR1_002930 [Brachionus plicatilis]
MNFCNSIEIFVIKYDQLVTKLTSLRKLQKPLNTKNAFSINFLLNLSHIKNCFNYCSKSCQNNEYTREIS